MQPYSQDHKFSKTISECFRDIGEYQFVNPIDSYPWGGRNRVIARIRVFEKYLQPEDVLKARWLQQQAIAAVAPNPTPGRGTTIDGMRARETGIVYINKLLEERSDGKYMDEMSALSQGLPSVMEYAEAAWGPTPAQRAAMRQERVKELRGTMRVISTDTGRHPAAS
jgi:hypothetical protein